MEPVYAVWIRNDFRLHDHPGLAKAADAAQQNSGKIMIFFNLHPHFTDNVTPERDYFFRTLEHFRADCREQGIHINIVYGSVPDIFSRLKSHYPALKSVFFIEDYTPFGLKRDQEASEWLHKHGITPVPLAGSHIIQPDELTKHDGSPYKVFTPYWRKWREADKPAPSESNPETVASFMAAGKLPGDEGEDYFKNHILPRCHKNWSTLGESDALERLETFTEESITYYAEQRDVPNSDGTSMLSPYIKTGSLSVRKVYHAAASVRESAGKGAETFLKELAWRDFYAMIYYYFPETKEKEFKEKYRNIEWNRDPGLLENWKKGNTGFPIVDAGMRQLNETGWMHNRLRMITASFLTKDYLIDWREGEAYFSEKLIDYDEASNIGGWQWAASTGNDAVPYFRVFNPVRQSERFDREGKFIKTFIPELSEVPQEFVHAPHNMPADKQKQYGFPLGKDYPDPQVDHSAQRKKAIALFKGDEET